MENMEVTILEDKKSKLHVEIKNSPVLAVDLVKKELWQNDHVKVVGTNIEHPLLKKQTFVLETDGQDPRKVIGTGVKKLQKELSKAKDSLKGLR